MDGHRAVFGKVDFGVAGRCFHGGKSILLRQLQGDTRALRIGKGDAGRHVLIGEGSGAAGENAHHGGCLVHIAQGDGLRLEPVLRQAVHRVGGEDRLLGGGAVELDVEDQHGVVL